MFGVNSINGSFQWLGVPDLLMTDVPPWTDYILAPITAWGNGGTDTNANWGRQPGGTYGSVAVLWIGTVHAMPAYAHSSPENTCIAARRVHGNIL